jgi:hypothetical protein
MTTSPQSPQERPALRSRGHSAIWFAASWAITTSTGSSARWPKTAVEQFQRDNQLATDGVVWAASAATTHNVALAPDHADLWSKAADRGAGCWPVLRHHGDRGSRRVHDRPAHLAFRQQCPS